MKTTSVVYTKLFWFVGVVSSQAVHTKFIQVIVGIFTKALGIERPALSILVACYSFAGEDNQVVVYFSSEMFAEL